MKAIILAAGMGTRLGKYTKDLPKCMLEFNGKTLIERQVDILKDSGISDIVIVTGYEKDKIKISGVKYYNNSLYAKTNMVETLFCAENEMDDEIFVCYADIIYEKRIIMEILASKSDIGVTVDNDYIEYWKARLDNYLNDIESLVIKDNHIIELGDTKTDIDKAKVRYVGLIKFSKNGVQILKKIYHENKKLYYNSNDSWKNSKSFKKAYMTCLLQEIIDQGHDINPIIIQRGWLEFDEIKDYERYNLWLKEGSLKRFIKF